MENQKHETQRQAAVLALSKKNNKKYRSRIVRSVMLVSSTVRDFEFYAGKEDASVKKFADYSTAGSLISTPTGILSNIWSEITAADLAPVDLTAKYAEIYRLLRTLKLEYWKDNKKMRDIAYSEVHSHLPVVLPGATGTTAAVVVKENKLLINSAMDKQSSVSFKLALPNNTTAFTGIDNYLISLYAEIFEEDK